MTIYGETTTYNGMSFVKIFGENVKKRYYIQIEKCIKRLLPLDNDTEIVIIADHGQIPINELIFMDLNKYDKYFYAFLAIDTGTSTFYVKKGWKSNLKKILLIIKCLVKK